MLAGGRRVWNEALCTSIASSFISTSMLPLGMPSGSVGGFGRGPDSAIVDVAGCFARCRWISVSRKSMSALEFVEWMGIRGGEVCDLSVDLRI